MKKYYMIDNETFSNEASARKHFTSAITKQPDKVLRLFEMRPETDLFQRTYLVKSLVCQHTPNLPSNSNFRIIDSWDVRKAKRLYCLQKYDKNNTCWKNYKLGDDWESLSREVNL